VTVLSVTVQQNDWLALSRRQVVKPYSVDARESIVDAKSSLRLNSCVGDKHKNEYYGERRQPTMSYVH
jgi:hypothetical protein